MLALAPLVQVVEVLHPGVAGISKTEMRDKLAKLYKVRPSAAAPRARSAPQAVARAGARRRLAHAASMRVRSSRARPPCRSLT
jgi:hypothetical protein